MGDIQRGTKLVHGSKASLWGGGAHPLKFVGPLQDGKLGKVVRPVGGWLSRLTLGKGGTRTAPATGFEK